MYTTKTITLCRDKQTNIEYIIPPSLSYTVEPLILVALNFGVQVHKIILAPLILASLLTELRDCC